MLIQFWHSSWYDYEKDLYNPIKQSILSKENQIILPHDEIQKELINSKDSLKNTDIFFAEVSYPSTWLWIELGFANLYWVKIICFYKKWLKISSSISNVCKDFFEYKNKEEMLENIEKNINLLKTNSL